MYIYNYTCTNCTCTVHTRFHTEKGRGALDFRPNLFQHATTSQLQAFWRPEATSESLNFKTFLREHPHTPPGAVCLT